MKSDLDLSQIFKESHTANNKKEKLYERLEKLRLKHVGQLIKYKNNLKHEICEMLRLWLEDSKFDKKGKIKLYRVKDRLKDLISFYKNCHDRQITPTENYYLKNYVKTVQEKLNTN